MTEGRWVADTNILISRLLSPGGTAARALDHALTRGVLLMSDASLTELATVLGREKFDRWITHDQRRQFIALLGGVSRKVVITRQIHACRDPRDDMFLDVALTGAAHAIITGDADLLALHPFHGVPIVTPSAFLSWP